MRWLASSLCRAAPFSLINVSTFSAEDEINLLAIVVDVNPIWWGQQAQREPEVVVCSLDLFGFLLAVTNATGVLYEVHKEVHDNANYNYVVYTSYTYLT